MADTLNVERDWTAPGVDTLQGITPLRVYGSFIDSLKQGELIVIGDTSLDPRTSGAVDALASRATRSFLNVPVIENGELVAVLFVNSSYVRTWLPNHISLLKEVAKRTRAEVERARSAAALIESERHLRLMVLELNHRVKNSLAVVQSIAAQTLRGGPDVVVARKAFTERIQALAVARDILTDEQWDGLKLGDVIHGVLDALQSSPSRLTVEGPAVYLSSKAGLSFSLALHELGTNAIKYGAFSNETGKVHISWKTKPDDPEYLEIVWRELGGPPVVEPRRRGFGSRLVEKALASEIGGSVEIVFDPAGVCCHIIGRMLAV